MKHHRNPNSSHRPAGLFGLCVFHLGATYVLLASIAPIHADTPSVSYIFPAGGQRGTSVAFYVGGHYLHEVCPFEMLGPGVRATPQLHRAPRTVWFEGPRIPMPASQRGENYPKDQAGAVAIAPDAPLGLRRFRVWTSQGAIPSMKFVIGDFPEILEQEIDGLPVPVPVQLPVTINGRIFPREDVDIWTFTAQAGRSYTCEVMANRIGSPLDSRLEILGPGGRRIAENVDGKGSDSFVQFTATAGGEHQVRIHDIKFGGLQHYVYRLTINDGPHVNFFYPLGGRKGKSVAVQLAGVNLPSQPVNLQLPDGESESLSHRFSFGGRKANAIQLELSDLPEHVESEPNQDTAPYALPAVFNGRIGQAGEEDVWTFQANQGVLYDFDVRASRLGSRLDSVLTVRDETGKVLAENDNLAGDQTDSRLQWTVPADGVYSASVRERTPRRGGINFAYRLQVSPPLKAEPDFQLTLPADSLTLNRGEEAKYTVQAQRSGGCDGPIELSFGNLPPGVTLSDTTIAKGKAKVEVKFKAEKTAKIQAVRLQISGKCKIGEREVTRQALTAEKPLLDHLLLAVSLPTPFKVIGAFETNYVARGATYFRHYSLDRGGFEGPLRVRLADRQVRHLQGIAGSTIVVPAGVSEFDYKIKLPPWMQAARTSRTVVMAVGEITDADGTRHKVSYTSPTADDQIIMMVTTEALSVEAFPKSILAAPGKSVPLKIKVGRGKSLTGPVRLRLLVPEHIRGVAAREVVLPADASEIVMSLNFSDNDLGPFNMPLVVCGTAQKEGQPYTAEGEIDILLDK